MRTSGHAEAIAASFAGQMSSGSTQRTVSEKHCLVPVLDFLARLPAEMSMAEAMTELVLTAHQQLYGQAFPSLDTIGEYAHCSRDTAKRAVRALESRRRIEVDRAQYDDRGLQTSNLVRLKKAGVYGGCRMPPPQRRMPPDLQQGTPALIKTTDPELLQLAAAETRARAQAPSAAPSMPAPEAEESAAASLAQEAPSEPAEAAEALEAITARFGASAGPVARSSLRQGRATQAEATLVLTTLVLRYADPSAVRNLGGLVTRLLQQARSGALEDAREKVTAEKEKSARRLAAERAERERIRQLEQQYVRGIDPEERSGVAQDIAGFLEQLRLKAGGGDLGAAS